MSHSNPWLQLWTTQQHKNLLHQQPTLPGRVCPSWPIPMVMCQSEESHTLLVQSIPGWTPGRISSLEEWSSIGGIQETTVCGTQCSGWVHKLGIRHRLDVMISEVFTNLSDSMITVIKAIPSPTPTGFGGLLQLIWPSSSSPGTAWRLCSAN